MQKKINKKGSLFVNLTEQYRKRLVEAEEEIVLSNEIFCLGNNIEWTKEHSDCLRNAMRSFFAEAVYPILKEICTNVESDS